MQTGVTGVDKAGPPTVALSRHVEGRGAVPLEETTLPLLLLLAKSRAVEVFILQGFSISTSLARIGRGSRPRPTKGIIIVQHPFYKKDITP